MNETDYKEILHKEVSKISKFNIRFHRVSSMLLDHLIMTMVIVPPWLMMMNIMISEI